MNLENRRNLLLEQLLNRANLLRAWKRVRANGGAAGVDGLAIKDFPAWLQAYWPEVKASLLDSSYKPSSVRESMPATEHR